MKSESLFNKVIIFILIFISLVAYSVTGYMLIEGWDFFQSLYMSVITLSTVGYGEMGELSNFGRMHTMVVIIVGVGFFTSMVVYISSMIIEGNLRGIIQKKSMQDKIKKISDHYIICGYGRIGREICSGLIREKVRNFVVVDNDEEKLKEAEKEGYLVFKGDATEDDTLIQAGIKRAKGIVCALTDDALNVFITLSSRVLNYNIRIISRADKVEAIEKLKRAGAHIVITPYLIGGQRMATALTHPNILDFLESILYDNSLDLKLEEIVVNESSLINDKLLKESRIRDQSGAIILAIRKMNKKLISNPSPDYKIEKEDIFIALGNQKQLEELEKMAKK